MAKKTRPAPRRTPRAPRIYARFTLSQRIQHAILVLSFTALALTGLPQKFPTNGVSIFFIGLLGGIEFVRSIHHFAATVLMLATIYHLVDVGYKFYVLRLPLTMLPSLQDIKDGWQALMHNLGLSKSRPQMGRYTFEEKMEYWSLVWGLIIMGLTGFLMWNPLTSARVLPGQFIPAAKVAHGAEALLAVLAIIIWHMYGVHLRRFNKAMFTGQLSEEEMLHEHPLELADIKAGLAAPRLEAAALRRRQRIYYPVAGILSVVMLAAVYGFVRGEETALTTVPPAPMQVTVFVPQTPTPLPTSMPTSTPLPTPAAVALTWEGYVAPLFQQKCTACHGAAATGGLNLSTYADLLKGGAGGAAIVPGESAASRLVEIQSAGEHPGQLSAEELAHLIEWIDAGAPER